MKKPSGKPMKVIQIEVPAYKVVPTIYGLGDDGLVYKWDFNHGQWILYRRDSEDE